MTKAWLSMLVTCGAAAVALVATPTAAQAGDWCYYGAFCWYEGYYQSGDRGSFTQYSTEWVRMPSLVDFSMSSYERQTADSCGTPEISLSDTYYSRRWSVPMGANGPTDKFNALWVWDSATGTASTASMDNKFNDIRNLCWR